MACNCIYTIEWNFDCVESKSKMANSVEKREEYIRKSQCRNDYRSICGFYCKTGYNGYGRQIGSDDK